MHVQIEYQEVLDVIFPDLAFKPRKLKPKPRPVRPVTSAQASAPADSAPADTAEVADASAPADCVASARASAPIDAAADVSVRQKSAFLVQVMQSAGSILPGDFAADYVTRLAVNESTSAQDIHSGFAPFMRTDLLQGPSVGPRDVSFCALHADSQCSNKLCINKVEESLGKHVLVHNAHCLGHQINIVCDECLRQKDGAASGHSAWLREACQESTDCSLRTSAS